MTQTSNANEIITRSTFEIRDRARAAVAQGKIYHYAAPSGSRVTIMYVAGGSFLTVSDRGPDGLRRKGHTFSALDALQAEAYFLRCVEAAAQENPGPGPRGTYGRGRGHGFHAGVIAAIGLLSERIKALDVTSEAAVELRRARRDLLALLDAPAE